MPAGNATLNPFGQHSLPQGMKYQADFLSAEEERILLDEAESLPFREFEFHGFTGKRRTVSFGWRYDEIMYPSGAATRVIPGPTAERWEGAARPGHFIGVLTVVAKLFHLVEPDVAVFGQKDIQQAVLIRQMVRDLDWPIELVIVPTVREADGLALSSRNAYLDTAGRRSALGLSAALRAAHDAWRRGERNAEAIETRMRAVLERYPGLAVEYIALAEPDGLSPVSMTTGETVVAIAGRVGATRLIDNISLGRGIG